MSEEVRTIKKYPNRRLYDTRTSCYITLEDVRKLVLEHVRFKVEDARTRDDLTRAILLQIILEEEGGPGTPIFSCESLSHVIRFYGNAMQGMIGDYLEKNILTFIEIQKKLCERSGVVDGGAPAMLNTDAWGEFLKMQGPAIQSLMGNYLEQSATAFLEMQQQMHKQTRSMMGTFPFPDFAAAKPFAQSQRNDAAGGAADDLASHDGGGKKDGA